MLFAACRESTAAASAVNHWDYPLYSLFPLARFGANAGLSTGAQACIMGTVELLKVVSNEGVSSHVLQHF